MTYYFPILIVRQKLLRKFFLRQKILNWFKIPIVFIKGTWKLVEMNKFIPSSDGRVRDVEVRYKVQKKMGENDGQQDMIVNR